MKTELDIHDYQCWYLDNLQYQDGLLTLTLEESSRVVEGQNEHKRYLLVFSDTIQFQIYDECDHQQNFYNQREGGVVGLHGDSSLLKYLKSETLIFDTTPGELMHYSVMTGNEFIHVITRRVPQVINAT
ncbi:hypothetical protein [Aliiglaciecola litoralis]|uniref:hypothetical protein n=1 Tax=Aliiglaciecola litoralis TaxID=582857 RepID=UPI0031E3ABE5